MYHSVTFGSKNTFADWHLVPDGRPSIVMPEPKKVTVDIPGRNGILDLSEAIRHYPVFNNREGSIKFHVLNGYGDWHGRYEQIANYVHGKSMQVRLEDEPGWYYTGRVTVKQWTSNNDGTWSDIEFGYDLHPYKLSEDTTTTNAWKWDSFNFINGFIIGTRFKQIPIESTSYKTIDMEEFIGSMPVTPSFIVTSPRGIDIRIVNRELGLNIEKKGITTGTYNWPEVIFTNMTNNNDVTVSVKKVSSNTYKDTVSIDYRWGSL